MIKSIPDYKDITLELKATAMVAFLLQVSDHYFIFTAGNKPS